MKPFYIRLSSTVLIACLGIVVYSNTFHCSFHFDDILNIVDNSAIKNIQDLQRIWAFYPCRFITFLSLAANYHFSGLHVAAYHLFNLAVHLGSAFFVWWLTLLTLSTPLIKKQKISQHADFIALFAGLIFVSHPLQTEAVTYIWQRAASMAALFYLASLCLYVKSRLSQDSQRIYYTGALITAVVAMLTKENAITLPLMMVLYEISFFEDKKGLNGRRLWPFFLCILIIPLLSLLTESTKIREIQTIAGGSDGISPLQYFLTQLRVMVTYIRLIFLPLHQNLDYDYPVFKSIFELPVLLSFLFLGAILFAAKYLFLKYRLVSFSIFWFFLTLMPESSFLPQKDVIFEHRLYLPLVGYSLFLVSGVYYGIGLLFRQGVLRSFASLRMTIVALTLIVAFNSILTYQRNKVWRNEFTLWDDAVKRLPHKARPYNNRGNAYFDKGNFAHAMSDFNKAIEIDPKYAESYTNRGNLYTRQGRFTDAVSDYDKAIGLNPNISKSYYDRGFVFAKQGDFIRALRDYDKTIEMDPDKAEAYNYRGYIYFREGNLTQALSDCDKAVEINPDYAEAYYNRGVIYAAGGDLTPALTNYDKAIEIDPGHAEAYTQRGIIYAKENNFTAAISDFNKAIEINSHDADAYDARGTANAQQGNYTQAISDYTRAIEINPHDAGAYSNIHVLKNILTNH